MSAAVLYELPLVLECYFDPAFWKSEDAEVKIVVYYYRHELK
jgi:hypothetical protein